MSRSTGSALPGDSMTYGTWTRSVTTKAVVSSDMTVADRDDPPPAAQPPTRRRLHLLAGVASGGPVTIALGVLRFVIGLVVVGAALAIAARVVMNGAPQPATDQPGSDRDLPQTGSSARSGRRRPRSERVTPTPWWVRARAVVLLSALLALLGAFLALLVVLGGALILTGLKNAVQ